MTIVINVATLGSGGFRIGGNSPNDSAGYSVSSAGDLNGDGFDDVVVGVPYADLGGNEAGAAYVIFGKAGGFAPLNLAALAPADGFAIVGDIAGDRAGVSVSDAGDVNGDGLADLVVGARGGDDGGPGSGEAYVIFGKAAGLGTIDLGTLLTGDGFQIVGADSDDAGRSVAGAGDFNNDGFDDLIIGATGRDLGGTDTGGAYLVFGKGSGFGTVDLAALTPVDGFAIQGIGAFNFMGRSVSSAGDVNNDGFDDVIIGALQGEGSGTDSGQAFVLFGKSGGFSNVNLALLAPVDGFVIEGGSPYDLAGTSVSSAGDVNGDGFDDIAVGAIGVGYGAAYVVLGKAGGFGPVDLGSLPSFAGFIMQGQRAGGRAGYSVAGAGDVNGDGFDDLIVGEPFDGFGAFDPGNAYIVYGKARGFEPIDLVNIQPEDGFVLTGASVASRLGLSVSAAGDVDGDGFDDVIVGATNSYYASTTPGEAYVVFGAAPTDSVTRIGTRVGQTIRGGLGDDMLDGRDGADFLFGADGDDELIGGSGADRLDGGAGFDRLRGGSGNDDLDGGVGGDVMSGGSGNDGYRVNSAGDRVVELADNGVDRIFARISYTLTDSVHVETLNTHSNGSTTAIDLTGNSIANKITGNEGANRLRGAGGNDVLSGLGGNDHLYGGAGRDTFDGGAGLDRIYFDIPIETASLADRINGFVPADDAIMLDRAIFSAISANGALAAAAYRMGTAALDSSDRIIFHSATGNIFYDADGNGAGAQVQFAKVTAGTTLTRGDFQAYSSAAAAAPPAAAFGEAQASAQSLPDQSRWNGPIFATGRLDATEMHIV
ncbi:hypothetical protein ACFQRC_11195 [Enterovirga sp. GCM10030262]|uniref:hypothetical protein n=1 Tax=Enterovirga sp. GCM10030262 TaxID=3273391 RepID=UPI00360E6A78